MSTITRFPLHHNGEHVATLVRNELGQIACDAEPPYSLAGWKKSTRECARAMFPDVHRGMTRQSHSLFAVKDIPHSLVVYASVRKDQEEPLIRQHDSAGSLWLVLDELLEDQLSGLFVIALKTNSNKLLSVPA